MGGASLSTDQRLPYMGYSILRTFPFFLELLARIELLARLSSASFSELLIITGRLPIFLGMKPIILAFHRQRAQSYARLVLDKPVRYMTLTEYSRIYGASEKALDDSRAQNRLT